MYVRMYTHTHTHTHNRQKYIAAFVDYNLPDGFVTLNSGNQFDPLCVSISLIDDNIQESQECFTVFFFDMDNDPTFDVIEPNQAMVCINDDDSAATRKLLWNMYIACRLYISKICTA